MIDAKQHTGSVIRASAIIRGWRSADCSADQAFAFTIPTGLRAPTGARVVVKSIELCGRLRLERLQNHQHDNHRDSDRLRAMCEGHPAVVKRAPERFGDPSLIQRAAE